MAAYSVTNEAGEILDLVFFPGYPVLTGMLMMVLPEVLSGYLAATEKPLATVSLCSDRKDPVLAWWQYGAGRVACWTSDVQGGWSAAFLNWDRAAEFFAGIISWSAAFLNWDRAAEFFAGIISFLLPDRSDAGEMSLDDGKLTWEAEVPEETAHVLRNGVFHSGDIGKRLPDGNIVVNGLAVGSLATAVGTALIHLLVLVVKSVFFCWVWIWVRWTLPRFRYDHVMNLGWKIILNIALINLVVTAVIAKLVGGN